ncbi:pyridoxal phosphate biosynthetic protein [Qipengyuania nanhaisediminis]|uniref:pyridoxal phosphate biosynthetic protein n=1 Tax=Qipengyuania nanhaisediminis TaxID=604088 RepID=UPI0038B2369D
MGDHDLPALTSAQKFWAGCAAILFLIAVGLLGYAINTGVLRTFAIGWVGLQIFGFVGAIKFSRGDFAHPLFISQVMLHLIALVLLVTLIVRSAP